MKKSLLLLFALCCFGCAVFKKTLPNDYTIAFYNVENLFDTLDDLIKNDEDFTPGGKLQWTPERYQTKLNQLAKVAEALNFPALFGLCEVENATVLRDFCEKATLKPAGYGIVHYDSPDERGIDVALLYRKNAFKVLSSEAIPMIFPPEVYREDPDPATRDVLYVQGIFVKKDTLHVFVVHAPSRSGGVEKTEPERLFVMEKIRERTDALFSKNSAANVIIMGDFNDETTDKSITQSLGAQAFTQQAAQASSLYNLMAELDAEGKGTYNFRGNWNMLDQVIVSGNLLKNGRGLRCSEPSVFWQEWLLYTDPKYGKSPNRTYGGERYYGGFSDHLPVSVKISN
jgi:endonuclease/exonuclease/phosphatase family metal-dependent hydrolase